MKITLAAAAIVSLAGPAIAETVSVADYFRYLFQDAKGYACFTRAYDQAHLDAHPRQNVASVVMLADDIHPGQPIILRLRLTFRKPAAELYASVYCDGAQGDHSLKCQVLGLNGEVDVLVKPGEPVYLSVPAPVRLWKAGAEYQDPEEHPPFGSDDKLFQLERQSDETCAALMGDKADQGRTTTP